MRRLAAALAMWTLCACQDGGQGTIVGNPGDGFTALAPGDGITHRAAMTFVEEVSLKPCDSEFLTTVRVDAEVDLFEGAEFAIPGGEFCTMTVHLGDTLFYEGADDDTNVDVFAELVVEDLDVGDDDAFAIDGGQFIFEFAAPGWASREQFGIDDEMIEDALAEDEPIEFGEDDEVAVDLGELIATTSALLLDSDGDRVVDEDERDEDEVAEGAGRDDFLDPDDDGADDTGDSTVVPSACAGCASQTTVWPWPLLAVGLALTRRRRVS